MNELSEKQLRLKDHIMNVAVRTDGPFTLRSGKVSSWYLDGRQTTFNGAGARLVAEAVMEQLADGVVAVGGMTMGADPIAIATALVSTDHGRPLNAFSIRKTAKEHGTGGRLVGPVRSGDRVCIVEDTTTTGGAITEAIESALEGGLIISQVVCLVDRSAGIAAEYLADRDIPYVALLTPQSLGVET